MEILDKAKSTKSQQKKVEKVMSEFKQGKLKSGSGDKVTDRDQAIAIALSEADLNKVEKALETLGVYDLISDIYRKEIEIVKVEEIVKGKTLPVGTIKKRGVNNFIKTASGWKYHSRATKKQDPIVDESKITTPSLMTEKIKDKIADQYGDRYDGRTKSGRYIMSVGLGRQITLNEKQFKERYKDVFENVDRSEDFTGKKVKVGDNVRIGNLQSDPIAKQGQYGKIIQISDGGKTVHVKFGDSKVGMYTDGSFYKVK